MSAVSVALLALFVEQRITNGPTRRYRTDRTPEAQPGFLAGGRAEE